MEGSSGSSHFAREEPGRALTMDGSRDESEGEVYFHLREVDRKVVLARREDRGAESRRTANIEEGSNGDKDLMQQLPRDSSRGRR